MALISARQISAYTITLWHHLRHNYLSPIKTLMEMENPETKVENQDKAMRGKIRKTIHMSCSFNGSILHLRTPILDDITEALGDPNTHTIGVYGSNGETKDLLIEKVCRRVERDNLFDVVVTATITKKPDIKKIQNEIAGKLGLMFNEKSKSKRALELLHRIKNVHKILVILCDLHKGFDLGKVGIPFGANHKGCKLLLTSTREDKVLSNHIRTQKNIML